MNEHEQRLIERLARLGAGIEPPAGAFDRIGQRATPAPPRHWFGRVASAGAALGVSGLIVAAAYGAPADGALFPLQRGLDGVALAAPLPPALHARLARSVAERRAEQAAAVAPRAPSTLVASLLDESSTSYDRARAAARTLPARDRAAAFTDLAASRLRAAAALRAAEPLASEANAELVGREERELEQEAASDEAEQDEAENELEHEDGE